MRPFIFLVPSRLRNAGYAVLIARFWASELIAIGEGLLDVLPIPFSSFPSGIAIQYPEIAISATSKGAKLLQS